MDSRRDMADEPMARLDRPNPDARAHMAASLADRMRAPGIYIRMLVATLAFCVLCYLHYGSLKTTLYYGIICLVLMQVGYVGGVLFMVWRESARRRPMQR